VEGGGGGRGGINTTAYPRRYPIRRRLPACTSISTGGSDGIRVLHADDASIAGAGLHPPEKGRGVCCLLLTVLAGTSPSWMLGGTCTTIEAEHHRCAERVEG
jgi:hypothetical protein